MLLYAAFSEAELFFLMPKMKYISKTDLSLQSVEHLASSNSILFSSDILCLGQVQLLQLLFTPLKINKFGV